MPPLLFPIIAAAALPTAAVVGWRARGSVDEFTGNVNTATGAISTIQLVLVLALLFGGYRFVRAFTK